MGFIGSTCTAIPRTPAAAASSPAGTPPSPGSAHPRAPASWSASSCLHRRSGDGPHAHVRKSQAGGKAAGARTPVGRSERDLIPLRRERWRTRARVEHCRAARRFEKIHHAPEPKSSPSTSAVFRPRVAASKAAPTPVAPPGHGGRGGAGGGETGGPHRRARGGISGEAAALRVAKRRHLGREREWLRDSPPMMRTSNCFPARSAASCSRRDRVVLAGSAHGSGGSGAAGIPWLTTAQAAAPAAAAPAVPAASRRRVENIVLTSGERPPLGVPHSRDRDRTRASLVKQARNVWAASTPDGHGWRRRQMRPPTVGC